MASSSAVERLQALESIEKEIAAVLQNAGLAVQELCKDKPNERQLDRHTGQFLKSLQDVESGLSQEINYLTQVATGQPHEGSSYSAQKETQMALHRVEHAKKRLADLNTVCSQGSSQGSQQ
ncbi:PREDICTED: mediator of RNA polymerase II transcription subunit 11-like [Branchiostoma belcheri]|uniref:Mediator of RNA polymerase II transcription subunit 11 n=1 Tax=Branchiostoma belcheri TaxID=7741 RepID=A0A6P4YH15_BRABE|nr:PREDICTED: mediator of RNA polymerase II transcription subunit 11-like [Branchiostoma belcheri]